MYMGKWQQITFVKRFSGERSASFKVKFNGSQIGLYGLAQESGGYVSVVLQDSKGKTVLSAIVDMYCKYPVSTLRFLSPVLKRNDYTLIVTVMGLHWKWIDKSLNVSGSKGNVVSIDKIIVNK